MSQDADQYPCWDKDSRKAFNALHGLAPVLWSYSKTAVGEAHNADQEKLTGLWIFSRHAAEKNLLQANGIEYFMTCLSYEEYGGPFEIGK